MREWPARAVPRKLKPVRQRCRAPLNAQASQKAMTRSGAILPTRSRCVAINERLGNLNYG